VPVSPRDGRTADETAARVGLGSRRKVKRVRALQEGDPDSLQAVLEGRMSIAQAEREMRVKRATKAQLVVPAVLAYIDGHPGWEYAAGRGESSPAGAGAAPDA
jgi:hypothetical protein